MHMYAQVHTQIRYTRIGEGDGSPLQYSCLGNPMERGAWWATGKKKKCLLTSKDVHAVDAGAREPALQRDWTGSAH